MSLHADRISSIFGKKNIRGSLETPRTQFIFASEFFILAYCIMCLYASARHNLVKKVMRFLKFGYNPPLAMGYFFRFLKFKFFQGQFSEISRSFLKNSDWWLKFLQHYSNWTHNLLKSESQFAEFSVSFFFQNRDRGCNKVGRNLPEISGTKF